jgi:hypothetical protein
VSERGEFFHAKHTVKVLEREREREEREEREREKTMALSEAG